MPDHTGFYVTTPIYYVNDKPHIGHAYTTILADVLARYNRLLNHPTFFLTGTDEHGQKVFEAAAQNGIEPLEQCDRTVVRFQQLWEKLEITNDDFIRTTEQRHRRIVTEILQELYDRDEIYQAEYEGWYCVPCERFFTEKDLADGKCPECDRVVEKLVEQNYFFRMSQYQEWLVAYIQEHPDFIQPPHRRQETLGFLRQPLGDLCVSRPKRRLPWGIELPFDTNYVTYVWFDALVNYISAVGYRSDDDRFRRWWPASCHLIGKDILTTHTVYWPTMLKAMGLPLPEHIFAHGWWLVGRDKMSKSLGNVVNPMEMAELYGVDAFRYFLMAEMTLGQDASFTEDAFITRYNADLANDLGNLASRVVKMALRDLDGHLPPVPEPTAAERDLVDTTLAAVTHMESNLASMKLDRGLAEVFAAIRAGNRYFERLAPWKLADAGDQDALRHVLSTAAECLRIVSGLLFPVMPGKMTELRIALGIPEDAVTPQFATLSTWGGRPEPTRVQKIASLFPRVKRRPATPPPAPQKGEEAVGIIDVAALGQVDLRTAEIMAAEPVPGADKLLRLELDVAGQKRQIVAGIAKHYAPEDLPGRMIVIVANLEPAIIRGVESNGMLLAAGSGKTLRLVSVDGDIPSGAKVK